MTARDTTDTASTLGTAEPDGAARFDVSTDGVHPVSDETEIRRLIEQWADAVHTGDLHGVLADHAPEIVMFDVPAPHNGVRGIDAYRATWPPFFEYQRQGALFELVELEVTAGDTVAFAHALLRCGTPAELDKSPDSRLRLTIGLRKHDDRWIVAHEHHSFAAS